MKMLSQYNHSYIELTESHILTSKEKYKPALKHLNEKM